MTFKQVDSRYHGPSLEQAVLTFWDEHAVFAKTLQKSDGRPRFSFCEGPPTANGKPGIHHVLARTFKDIYPRYKTMRGYYAPRKGGWDTHGLPVEHEIEKQLGIFDKKAIESQLGVAEFTRRCRQSVMTYINDWEAMTRRMGYWVNLEQAYYTLDNDYIESVWHLLQRIWQKGLIYKGNKVVPYDPRIGATLSSHEVAQGYKTVEDPSITLRFAVADHADTYFLVWTTTPWTLPANLLLAVAADIDYAWVECDNQRLILAAARLEAVLEGHAYRVIKTTPGRELVGMRYQRVFDYLPLPSDNCLRVVSADFVSTSDGTGIVHTAPAYGVDDLALGQREGVPVLHAVGLDGHFKPEAGPLAGLFFKDADAVINQTLTARGLMFKEDKTLHNYPFGWRTGDPLIYYAKAAWYIRTSAVKARMVALNKTIYWVPSSIRDGRFGKWLENNVDWALSRERFWGTPLPIWTDGDEDFICVGSVAELAELVGRPLHDLDLHRPEIDQITFTKNGKEYHRVPEVIDCWFDSGAMSYAQWHYPFENQHAFAQHFPADYICEAIDQTRGWFYTLHAIAALVDDSVAFKNCVCLSHIVDQHGKKMSKSQGNIVNPYDVFDTVGVDSLRWLFLARTAADAQKRISVDIVKEVAASFVNTLWNTYAFFTLYARLDQVDLSKPVAFEQRPEIDRWVLALAHGTLGRVTTSLDRYDAKAAGEAIEKLVDQLSNWYVRRNRRRFWKSEVGADKQSAYLTLYECLLLLDSMLAPFMPFLSEAIYQNLRRAQPDAELSVHLTEWPQCNTAYLNPDLVFEMDVVQQVVGLARTCREDSRVRVRQPLSRVLVQATEPRAAAAIRKHQAQILEELNVKSLELLPPAAELLRYTCQPNFSRLGKRYGKLMPSIKRALATADAAWIATQVATAESFSLCIDGQDIEFDAADIHLKSGFASGYSGAQGNGYLVALDTTLDEALRVEGIARELVRSVQDARKAAGLQPSDRIELSLEGSCRVLQALSQHREYIYRETLAQPAAANANGDLANEAVAGENFVTEKSLDEEHWRIQLRRRG